MAQRLIQTQKQTLSQTLTPQQLLQVHLLELPLRDFEQRVNDEILENEALEEGDDNERHDEEENGENDYGDEETKDADSSREDALADYLNADDTPDYLLDSGNGDDEKTANLPFGQQTSLYEELTAQIAEHHLSDEQKRVMVYLIGSLDSDGFLRKDSQRLSDEMGIYHNINVSPQEIDKLVSVMQTFEPRGIGARNLQECLKIQILAEDNKSPYKELELQVIEKCYKDFTRKRWDAIARRLHVDTETMDKVMSEIRHLNPRPGSALTKCRQAIRRR